MKPFLFYFHIPYCLHKCRYCDFNSYPVSIVPEKDYVAALLAEMDFRGAEERWSGRLVSSIYFGGGTPSLLSPAAYERLLEALAQRFAPAADAEITLEANPGTVAYESLAEYRRAGINRLSIGAQTFSSAQLELLGRIHSPEQIAAAVHAARRAGFENISLDLIYGLPGQRREDLRADLQQLAALEPQHVSAYGLTIEKGTELEKLVRRGDVGLPDEDLALELMREVRTFLEERGYRRYEVSNFSRPKFEARHNSGYWRGCDYLGLGAGAHSFVRRGGPEVFGERWANLGHPGEYMAAAASAGSAAGEAEQLSRREAIFEFFFLGLRTAEGVSIGEFRERFGTEVDRAYPGLRDILCGEELLRCEDGRLALTGRGFELADSVIENFAEPESD